MSMPIKIIPTSVLEDIAADWEGSEEAVNIFGGQLTGQIQLFGSLASKEPIWPGNIVEPGNFQIFGGSELQDRAIMLWLSNCRQIGESTICRCWDNGYDVGADAVKDSVFRQLSVPETSIELLMTRQLLNQFGLEKEEELAGCEKLLGEIRELYEKELEGPDLEPMDFIAEFSQEFRAAARDEIQEAFLNAIHSSSVNLLEFAPFSYLKENGGDWEVSTIEDWSETAEFLLKPIDFQDPKSIALAFAQLPEEHWKQHRTRVRALFNNLPEPSRNNIELFRSIIPHVAAWVLEYASEKIRSEPDIIYLAVESDLRNNYSATAMKYASEAIKRNQDLVARVLDIQPEEYGHLPIEMRAKKDFAVKYAASGELGSIPEHLIEDIDVLKAYVGAKPSFAYRLIPEIFHEDLELAEAFLNAGGDFTELPSKVSANRNLFVIYIKNATKHHLSSHRSEMALSHYLEATGLSRKDVIIDFAQQGILPDQAILEFLYPDLRDLK